MVVALQTNVSQMNKIQKGTSDWLDADDDLLYKSSLQDMEYNDFELSGSVLKYSDLMSDGDVFGAEIRQLNKPVDGHWTTVIDNPNLFNDFDFTYSDHEIIIADGDSTIHDTSSKDTVIFSSGPEVEIHADAKSLDLFVGLNQTATVHSENSNLNIFSFESSEGFTKINGSLNSLNLHIFSQQEQSQQLLQVVDEKLVYIDSGKTIIDLQDTDLGVVDINVTFMNLSGIDGTDTISLFLDGPERDLFPDVLPSSEQLLFEEEIEIDYALRIEAQLFSASEGVETNIAASEASMFSEHPTVTLRSMEQQAEEAIQEISISQDLLGQDSLYNDPLDILIFDE